MTTDIDLRIIVRDLMTAQATRVSQGAIHRALAADVPDVAERNPLVKQAVELMRGAEVEVRIPGATT